MINSRIMGSIFIYFILLSITLLLVGWYFRWMLKVIFRNKLEIIDNLVEYGKLRSNYTWPLSKEETLNKKTRFQKTIITWQRIYSKHRIKSLMKFVEHNQFMVVEDKETYLLELNEIWREWKKL